MALSVRHGLPCGSKGGAMPTFRSFSDFDKCVGHLALLEVADCRCWAATGQAIQFAGLQLDL
jgi:hypothetical protein